MKLQLGAMIPEVMRHLFRRTATVQVPFVPVPAPGNVRGKPVMDPLKCIGCKRCQVDCPAEAIEINKEYEYKNEAGKLIRRFSMTLYIDRCTHCGQCVNICPVRPKALAFPDTEWKEVPVYNYSLCIRCYCCHETCPSDAIHIKVPLAGRILHSQ